MKFVTPLVIGILTFYLIVFYLVLYSNDSGANNSFVRLKNLFNHSALLGNDSCDEDSFSQENIRPENTCPIFFPVLNSTEAIEAYGYKNYGPCKLSSRD